MWLRIIILIICMMVVRSTFHYPDCVHDGLSCLTCTHRKMCVRWIPWFGALERFGEPQPCADALTGHALPYCDPGTNECVSYVPQQCQKEGSLSCLREEAGDHYPDVRDCKKYYRCDRGVPKVQECPSGLVYRQEWRKCIVNLNTNRDCFKVTKCPQNAMAYPGDASLYYRCPRGSPQVALLACPSSLDLYDPSTNTCEANQVCRNADANFLPVSYKCSAYYDCDKNEQIQCPAGQGFNQHTQKCALFYQNLCNEFGLLESDVKSFFGGFFLYGFVDNLFRLVNFSPYSFLALLPVPETLVSTSILVTDYLYKERSIPPALIGYIIEYGLSLIPAPIRAIIDMLLNFLPFNLPSAKGLTKDQAIALAVEEEFTKTNFSKVAENLQGIYSIPTGFQTFVKYVAIRLNIPQQNLYGILQIIAQTLSQTVNNLFGNDNEKILFMGDRELHLDENGLRQILKGQIENVAEILERINGDLSDLFRNNVEAYVHKEYQFVERVAKEVYLPLHV